MRKLTLGKRRLTPVTSIRFSHLDVPRGRNLVRRVGHAVMSRFAKPRDSGNREARSTSVNLSAGIILNAILFPTDDDNSPRYKSTFASLDRASAKQICGCECRKFINVARCAYVGEIDAREKSKESLTRLNLKRDVS